MVSGYFPAKGEAGTKVMIRGRNFAPGTEVTWAGRAVTGAQVKPREISFVVPRDAASGPILLRGGGIARPIVVGMFEVTRFDAEAEARRVDEERRKAAEAAWKTRQAKQAKDRAARDAELARREQELRESREQRRLDRQAELRQRWRAAFLADEESQAELALHAQRVASIHRMLRLAEARGDGKLVVRIDMTLARENERHELRMRALEAAFNGGGR